jgi:hypothetical protein
VIAAPDPPSDDDYEHGGERSYEMSGDHDYGRIDPYRVSSELAQRTEREFREFRRDVEEKFYSFTEKINAVEGRARASAKGIGIAACVIVAGVAIAAFGGYIALIRDVASFPDKLNTIIESAKWRDQEIGDLNKRVHFLEMSLYRVNSHAPDGDGPKNPP